MPNGQVRAIGSSSRKGDIKSEVRSSQITDQKLQKNHGCSTYPPQIKKASIKNPEEKIGAKKKKQRNHRPKNIQNGAGYSSKPFFLMVNLPGKNGYPSSHNHGSVENKSLQYWFPFIWGNFPLNHDYGERVVSFPILGLKLYRSHLERQAIAN